MATVRMRKGTVDADIFDSPETIKQAQKDGYSLVEKTFEEPKKEQPKVEEVKADSEKKTKTARQ